MPPEPASCAGCGAPLRRREGAWCPRCRQDRQPAAACPACGSRRLLLPGTGRCATPPRACVDCGKVVRPRDRDRGSRCPPPAHPPRARRPGGRRKGTVAGARGEFFTEAGLPSPAAQPAGGAAARCRAGVEEAPATLRPALARYAAALAAGKQRARQAGTRPRADATIAGELAILRDLALFLAAERGKTDWATTQAADLEAFLARRPASRARWLTVLRAFFRWTRSGRLVLADPAAGLTASRHRGFRGQTLALAEQRRLFRRWTTDPGVHPHEALAGLLALLHATPSRELRHLTVADVDASAHTVLLEHRPHPVPLDPATWQALQRCLDHRERLGTRNPHVIVTSHTRTRSTTASDQYLVRVLDPAGTGSRTLRATRLVDLVASLDPKLVCEALGMDPAGILPYAADQVQDTRLANL